ncbi:hypothetical protein EUX98_g2487 [Antrodiella citrinella]|uniref:Uncharacterized protein n=1 Tax=Antrodiella citrinella TaxID=2447956 RepID=A0A4V3XJ54_9APHY|nr:hypothetical protein EUX98_g2487 [Antrodiella citrinella]
MSEDSPDNLEHVFASLRLSEDDFVKYQRATDIAAFKRPTAASMTPIKVVGYGEDASAAIKAANTEGRDYLEVTWGPIDSMLWIMQRLEEQLRIPLKVWRLAGDGMVLPPGLLVGGHSIFKKENIELLLIPGNMMAQYMAENQKEHVWKHLTPGTTDSDDHQEKARATFHLLDPQESISWEVYYEQRTRADATFKGMLEQYSGEENHPLLDQIRAGFDDTLTDLDLTTEQQQAIGDGLVPFRFEVLDNWGDVVEADVMTRIYSPTKPSAVDVYFAYHRVTHYESAEFDCRLMYRIHDPIPSTDLAMPHPDIAPRPGFHGWRLVFEVGLADLPPGPAWRPIDQTLWGLQEPELNRIHAALFDSERDLATGINKVDTLRLLMAAVGIPFSVARDEEGQDGQDAPEIGKIEWELDHEEWIALNIRKVCGIPLERDAQYKPRSLDDEYYDDGGEDDDDDDDYYESENDVDTSGSEEGELKAV